MSTPAAPAAPPAAGALVMTPYQRLVLGVLAFLQFTVILDFMILSPLGPLVMPALGIDAKRFGFVVSAYALSAGVSGLLAATFADRFDRKRLLMVFYGGFLTGTVLCGLAPTYEFLLFARVFTGIFGGVISSISFAIVADLFPPALRGRAMGTIQSAFAASQVMGLPIGLSLATRFGWNGPFLLIAGVGALAGGVMAARLQPIRDHLAAAASQRPLQHLIRTATDRNYLTGFTATMLVATGGFMLQPFASNFAVHNLGVAVGSLPEIYMAAGLTGFVVGPLAGRVADRIGKFQLLALGTAASMAMVLWWTHLGPSPLWLVIAGNCLLFATINARQVSTMALISSVPAAKDRGAYMSISSSMQQLAGAVSSSVAGLLVVEAPDGAITNYPLLGWVVFAAMALTLGQMWNVDRMIRRRDAAAA